MKVAISIPDPIFDAAERLAGHRRIPRSRLFTQALEDYLDRHSPEVITARLDKVYGHESPALDEPLSPAPHVSLDHEAW